jgi:hypothetical protein
MAPPDKITYEQLWRAGRVRVETTSVPKLVELVRELRETAGVDQLGGEQVGNSARTGNEYPMIPGNLGCADAIRTLLATGWAATEGRTEAELNAAMKRNAIHFSHGTISGLLTAMTQRGELRRIGKKNGSYSYIINLDKNRS